MVHHPSTLNGLHAGRGKIDRYHVPTSPNQSDPEIMRWFECGHLPESLQWIARIFRNASRDLIRRTDPTPERDVALRKLLEAKDAAVRAKIRSRS